MFIYSNDFNNSIFNKYFRKYIQKEHIDLSYRIQSSPMIRDHVTFIIIQGTNFEMRVQTPGKLASAQPIPHEIIPAKKYRPS